MISAELQLRLNLKDARWRPVLCLTGAQTVLNLDAVEVCEMIECGALAAWNIAVNGADDCEGTRDDPNPRRCLRIFTPSVAHYLACGGSRQFQVRWPEILCAMIPHAKPFVTGRELQRSLVCDENHVSRLVCQMELVPGTTYRQGQTPHFTRRSVEAFLQRRLL